MSILTKICIVVLAVVALLACILLIVLLNDNEALSRAAMMLANPVMAYYDAVLLVEHTGESIEEVTEKIIKVTEEITNKL